MFLSVVPSVFIRDDRQFMNNGRIGLSDLKNGSAQILDFSDALIKKDGKEKPISQPEAYFMLKKGEAIAIVGTDHATNNKLQTILC